MKKFFSLLTLALLTMSAWAETTVTFDLTDQGYGNQQEVTTLTEDNVTITFNKGGSNNAPKWFDNGSSVRVYAKNTITVATTGNEPITGITFTFGSSDGTNAILSNVGTFVSPNWTGSETEVVFTIDGTSGNRRFVKIDVTLGGNVVETVADPVFTPGDGTSFIESQEISLTCGTTGATISYSTNGLTWETYTEPFTITETTTVYAKAAKNGVESNVVNATYTLIVPIEGNAGIFKSATDKGDGSTQRGEWTVVKNGVTMHCTDGTVYDENYRIYKDAILTISSNETAGNIVKIEFDGYSSNAISNLTPATGTMTINNNNGTWIGETNSVAFSASAQARASEIRVYVTGDVPVVIEVAAPTFNPAATDFDESIDVTLSAEDDATIYYNYDNSDNWNVYTAALHITETTTVYAKAVKGENESAVVSATYTKNEPVEAIMTLAAANELENNTNFTFGGNVVVVYQDVNSKNLWVKDDSAYGLIYGNVGASFEQGTVLNSGWTATKAMYQTIVPEFKNPANVTASNLNKVTVEPTVVGGIDENMMNQYIRINNVSVDSSAVVSGHTNFFANGLTLRNQFDVNFTPEDGKTYDFIGVVTAYQGAPQLYITEVLGYVAPQPVVVDVYSIAEAIEAGENTFAMYDDVVVTFNHASTKRMWIRDSQGNSGLIYGVENTEDIVNGTVLSDGWTGHNYNRYGVPQFQNTEGVAASGETREANPVEVEAIAVEDVNAYVIFKGINMLSDATNNKRFYNAADSTVLFNTFNVTLPTIEEGKTYDVTGVVTLYNNVAQLYITEVVEAIAGLRGDVDADGEVGISDATMLIDMLLNGTEAPAVADADLDGVVAIGDVTAIIDYLLTGAWAE